MQSLEHRGIAKHRAEQVLHCRGCSGTGLGLVYLVATCYLLFTTHVRHHMKALSLLGPIHLQHVAGALASPQRYPSKCMLDARFVVRSLDRGLLL